MRLIQKGAAVKAPIQTEGSQMQSQGSSEPQWSDLPGNLLPSAGRNLQAMVQPFINPGETVRNIGGLTAGGISKLIPGEPSNPKAKQAENLFDQLINVYKERYGGASNIKKTMIEDPTGFALDVASLLSGGGAALKGVGAAGKMNKVAQVGSAMQKVSEFVDPISLAGKVPGVKTVGKAVTAAPEGIVDSYLPRPKMAQEYKDLQDTLFKGESSFGGQVTDRTKVPMRTKKLVTLAHDKKLGVSNQIDEAIKPYLNEKVDVWEIVDPREPDPNRMTMTKLYEMINNSAIPNKQPILKDINEVLNGIVDKADIKGQIKIKDIYELRKNTDRTLDQFFQNAKSVDDVSPQQAISAVMANELRNVINDFVPDLKDLNHEYGVWKDIENAATVQAVKNKRGAKPTAFDVGIGGGAAGITTFTVNPLAGAAALLGPYIARRIATSSSTGLAAARMLQELIGGTQAVSKPMGATGRANYLLNREPQNATPGANLVQ